MFLLFTNTSERTLHNELLLAVSKETSVSAFTGSAFSRGGSWGRHAVKKKKAASNATGHEDNAEKTARAWGTAQDGLPSLRPACGPSDGVTSTPLELQWAAIPGASHRGLEAQTCDLQ